MWTAHRYQTLGNAPPQLSYTLRVKNLSDSCIVDLQAARFARRHKTVRLMPELDGAEALYDLGFGPAQLIARPLVAWSLSDTGVCAGMIAFDGELVRVDALGSRFKGYVDAASGAVSRTPPNYVDASLRASHGHFSQGPERVALTSPESNGHRVAVYRAGDWQFKRVIGWRLNAAGEAAPLVEQTSTLTDPPMLRRVDGRKLRGYAGIVDPIQAAQLSADGPIEARFIGLRRLYLI